MYLPNTLVAEIDQLSPVLVVLRQGLAPRPSSGHVERDGHACNPVLHVPVDREARDPVGMLALAIVAILLHGLLHEQAK